MLIYLARHGQTTGDLENRYGGDYEDHLTDTGKQQAASIADQLADKKIEALYASPRIRAQEAAAIISQKLGLPVTTLQNFRERNGYGILTGMVKEEATKQHPEHVTNLKNDPIYHAVEGAEAYSDFQQRITAAVKATNQQPYQTIAIVTHGGPIRLIFREILQLGEIRLDECAYVAIEVKDGRYTLIESYGITLMESGYHTDLDLSLDLLFLKPGE